MIAVTTNPQNDIVTVQYLGAAFWVRVNNEDHRQGPTVDGVEGFDIDCDTHGRLVVTYAIGGVLAQLVSTDEGETWL